MKKTLILLAGAMLLLPVKIYLSGPEFKNGTRKIIPGTFAILVYKPA